MKHLISLSFQYIRRQKLRTALTFLCITLAVFIMNTFTAYFSSVRQTMVNSVIMEEGAWEVDASRMLAACEDKQDAIDRISNHPVVSHANFYTHDYYELYGSRNEEGYCGYYSLQLDGKEPVKVLDLQQIHSHCDGSEENYIDFQPSKFTGNEAAVPIWLQDYGYKIGDTVTFTITPVYAQIDESHPIVVDVMDKLNELNQIGDQLYSINDDPDAAWDEALAEQYSSFTESPLISYIEEYYSFEEVPYCNEQYGESFTYTVTIADFDELMTTTNHFRVESGFDSGVDFNPMYEANFDLLQSANIWADTPTSLAYLRIQDHIDFDDGIMQLLLDMGFEEKDYYEFFPPLSEAIYHYYLLGFEAKSANAITTMLPVIVLVLLLALLVWFISRFVIDNAFEISVKERVSQFAVLRIMGASRGQLLALVFTEALFYCVTAVPIGVLSAFGMCKFVFENFHESGLRFFEFHTDPLVTFIGVVLCVAAILISAYTSAMWAARKLSPLEALNYAAPRKKARHLKKKSKLNLGSKRFIISYTMRNIKQNKQRFLISSIALCLGLFLFTFSALFYLFGLKTISYERNLYGENYDFDLYLDAGDQDFTGLAAQHFAENEHFASFAIYNMGYITFEEDVLAKLQPYLPDAEYFGQSDFLTTAIISRYEYETYLEPVSGVSYDDFVASETTMLYYSPYATYSLSEETLNADGTRKRLFEDGYQTFTAQHFASDGGENPIPISSVICAENPAWMQQTTLLLIPYENAEAMIPERFGISFTDIRLRAAEGDHYDDCIAAIDSFTEAYTEEFGGEVGLIDEYTGITGFKMFINAVMTAVGVFLISIWLVGVLSMVNSINTSVLNRRKELTMLRSVGMSRKQLAGSVMLESLLFALASTIGGVLLGVSSFFLYADSISLSFQFLGDSLVIMVVLVCLLILLLNLVIAALSALPAVKQLKCV